MTTAVLTVDLPEDIKTIDLEELNHRIKGIDNELSIFRREHKLLVAEQKSLNLRLADNKEKIKMNKQLPYLVGHVVEVSPILSLHRSPQILDIQDEDSEEGSTVDVTTARKGKCAVIKTSTRQASNHQ